MINKNDVTKQQTLEVTLEAKTHNCEDALVEAIAKNILNNAKVKLVFDLDNNDQTNIAMVGEVKNRFNTNALYCAKSGVCACLVKKCKHKSKDRLYGKSPMESIEMFARLGANVPSKVIVEHFPSKHTMSEKLTVPVSDQAASLKRRKVNKHSDDGIISCPRDEIVVAESFSEYLNDRAQHIVDMVFGVNSNPFESRKVEPMTYTFIEEDGELYIQQNGVYVVLTQEKINEITTMDGSLILQELREFAKGLQGTTRKVYSINNLNEWYEVVTYNHKLLPTGNTGIDEVSPVVGVNASCESDSPRVEGVKENVGVVNSACNIVVSNEVQEAAIKLSDDKRVFTSRFFIANQTLHYIKGNGEIGVVTQRFIEEILEKTSVNGVELNELFEFTKTNFDGAKLYTYMPFSSFLHGSYGAVIAFGLVLPVTLAEPVSYNESDIESMHIDGVIVNVAMEESKSGYVITGVKERLSNDSTKKKFITITKNNSREECINGVLQNGVFHQEHFMAIGQEIVPLIKQSLIDVDVVGIMDEGKFIEVTV